MLFGEVFGRLLVSFFSDFYFIVYIMWLGEYFKVLIRMFFFLNYYSFLFLFEGFFFMEILYVFIIFGLNNKILFIFL